MSFKSIFPGSKCTLIGMVHTLALPETPLYRNNDIEIINRAIQEAKILEISGFDGLIIENMFDTPYTKQVSPEITAFLTKIAVEIKNRISLPIGIQVLAGANREALAIAKAANLDFIRAEGFVFGHIGDEGYIDAQAGELLRYRKFISADHIQVWTDIKKKHSSHSVTADISIEETANAAEFFNSDGLIITGTSTGRPTDLLDIQNVIKESSLPIIIGSGINVNNIHQYLGLADGLIIGSSIKKDGFWKNAICETNVKHLVDLKNSFYNL